MLDNSDLLFEDFKQTFPARLEAAQTKAITLADALLTDAWKRLIGPAHRLVRALIVEMATSNDLFKPGEHLFSSLQDIARLIGVSERTVQRWLSSSYQGSFLARGVGATLHALHDPRRRPAVPGRNRLPGVARGQTHPHKTPAPRPRLEALKAKWRFGWELPHAQSQTDPDLENTVLEVKRHEKLGTITFPVRQGMFPVRVQVEGRDLELGKVDHLTLNSNLIPAKRPRAS